MAIEIRQALTDRGIPLDKGWRGAAPERVYYTKSVERTPSTESLKTVSSDYEDGTIRVIHEKGPYPRNERARGVRATREKGHPRNEKTRRTPQPRCFGYGKPGHFVRDCPHNKFSVSTQRGHDTRYCPSNRRTDYVNNPVSSNKRVYEITANEDAVTLQVRIEGRKVRAILDTGATPYVIDKGTVERLKLGR